MEIRFCVSSYFQLVLDQDKQKYKQTLELLV